MPRQAGEPLVTLQQVEGCAAQAVGELKRLTNRTVGISAVASQARLNRQLMVELLYKAAGEHLPVLAARSIADSASLFIHRQEDTDCIHCTLQSRNLAGSAVFTAERHMLGMWCLLACTCRSESMHHAAVCAVTACKSATPQASVHQDRRAGLQGRTAVAGASPACITLTVGKSIHFCRGFGGAQAGP